MKYILSFLTIFILISHCCLAQKDSSIIYMSKEGKETTKDSAYTYKIITQKDKLWYGRNYFVKTNALQSEGNFADVKCSIPVGVFNNYSEDGSLFSTAFYDNGKVKEITFYYKNGNKKAYTAYNNDNISAEKGWDENGKEIAGYIVQREARFRGGAEAWVKYLQKHLNGNVPVDAGAPTGSYTVVVEFLVSKEGFISNVKAVSVPPKCKPCAAEAVSVIMNGPNWEPAIQYNEPVNFRQRQQVTFQVAEKGKKKARD
ncbi:hypothetical protein BH10BAC2_BH10BAC2_42190 [soil metagenome]